MLLTRAMLNGPVSGPDQQRERIRVAFELCSDCRHCASCGDECTRQEHMERCGTVHVSYILTRVLQEV
jgi:hypothetical protein